MSSTAFGEHLKREREMRGVSLEEIAAATRISTRYLEALEGEHWEQLPGGVFNRGFIRSVARFLGLDEESLVAEYEMVTRDIEEVHPAAETPSKMPRDWRPAIAALVLVAALVAGGWFAYRRFAPKIAMHFHKRRASATELTLPTVTSAHAATATPAPAPGNSKTASAETPGKEPAATPDAKGMLELKMEAGKPADVEVMADGKLAFQGRIDTQQVKLFEAGTSFRVTSSDPSALFLELNGQTLPPIGTPGEPGSVTLTRKDLNAENGGSH